MPLGNFPGVSTCRGEKEGQRFRVLITLLKTKPELLPAPACAMEWDWKDITSLKWIIQIHAFITILNLLISSFRCNRDCIKTREHHTLVLVCSSLLKVVYERFMVMLVGCASNQSGWRDGGQLMEKGILSRVYLWEGGGKFSPVEAGGKNLTRLICVSFQKSLGFSFLVTNLEILTKSWKRKMLLHDFVKDKNKH